MLSATFHHTVHLQHLPRLQRASSAPQQCLADQPAVQPQWPSRLRRGEVHGEGGQGHSRAGQAAWLQCVQVTQQQTQLTGGLGPGDGALGLGDGKGTDVPSAGKRGDRCGQPPGTHRATDEGLPCGWRPTGRQPATSLNKTNFPLLSENQTEMQTKLFPQLVHSPNPNSHGWTSQCCNQKPTGLPRAGRDQGNCARC